MVCRDCGHIGPPVTFTPGSFAIEIVLWLFMILPGLIYTLWRVTSRHVGCSSCTSKNLVPLHSPGGRKIAEEMKAVSPGACQIPADTFEPIPEPKPLPTAESASAAKRRFLWGLLVIFLSPVFATIDEHLAAISALVFILAGAWCFYYAIRWIALRKSA